MGLQPRAGRSQAENQLSSESLWVLFLLYFFPYSPSDTRASVSAAKRLQGSIFLFPFQGCCSCDTGSDQFHWLTQKWSPVTLPSFAGAGSPLLAVDAAGYGALGSNSQNLSHKPPCMAAYFLRVHVQEGK